MFALMLFLIRLYQNFTGFPTSHDFYVIFFDYRNVFRWPFYIGNHILNIFFDEIRSFYRKKLQKILQKSKNSQHFKKITLCAILHILSWNSTWESSWLNILKTWNQWRDVSHQELLAGLHSLKPSNLLNFQNCSLKSLKTNFKIAGWEHFLVD